MWRGYRGGMFPFGMGFGPRHWRRRMFRGMGWGGWGPGWYGGYRRGGFCCCLPFFLMLLVPFVAAAAFLALRVL